MPGRIVCGDAEVPEGIRELARGENRQQLGGDGRGLACSGAAACRALRAGAHRARRCRRSAAPAPAGRRFPAQRAHGDRARKTGRAALLAPGILSPCKDHRQERSLRSRPSDGAWRRSGL